MEPTIFKFILRYSKSRQIALLLLTLVSFPFLYASLELPKTIINDAIGAQEFPKTLFNIQFDQIEYLLVLCAFFLSLVLINGAFKFVVNVYKGQLGERMLRRLRYLLYGRALRFPLPHFRRTSQGEVIAMITAEVEPLGGFIGDSFSLPAFQGGTLLTILAFMFVQDPILGLASISLYPLQMYLIPKLQKKVNALGKERVRTVRKLSERIGETVSGMQEVHSNDTSELELADFSHRVGRIYDIRYRIYRLKFMIKFLNNFLAQVIPFFFFSIGGYLVIQDDLTFGALVAVLAAYKDLSAPWKELLNYYQQKEDAKIKYDQLVDQFQPPGMLDEDLRQPPTEPVPALAGKLVASNLTLEEDGGIKVVDGVSFSLDLKDHTAVVGPNGAGRAALVQLMARLLTPTAGSITLGGHNLARLPQSVTGRRLAYIDQGTHLFSGSVKDNLLYGLKHQPLIPRQTDEAALEIHRSFVAEAKESGNTTSDLAADWIDYQAAGISSPEALIGRVVEVLRAVELEDDIYGFGLLGTIDPALRLDLAASILEARSMLHERLRDPALKNLVEPFDPERYNMNMSVAENLLFGYPVGSEFDLGHLGENAYVLSVLKKADLTESFIETGLKLATIMVDLFQDLPPDHEYFERFGFIDADELPQFQQFIVRAESDGIGNLEQADRGMLISLPFKLIPGRHRLGLIDAEMQSRILAARGVFAEELPKHLRDAVAFFNSKEYNAAASIQDNILFGKLVYGRQQAQQKVRELMRDVIDQLDLRQTVLELGLESPVGIGGSRLAVVQRRKLALARCLLKRADLMIVNDAVASLDPSSQTTILENVFTERQGRGLVWILSKAGDARHFDRTLVMEGGKVVEHGTFEELNQPGSRLHSLASAG